MPRGESVYVELNSVDPTHYQGWDGTLAACEYDARDMEQLARAKGFKPTVSLTLEATAEAVIGAIRAAAAGLPTASVKAAVKELEGRYA